MDGASSLRPRKERELQDHKASYQQSRNQKASGVRVRLVPDSPVMVGMSQALVSPPGKPRRNPQGGVKQQLLATGRAREGCVQGARGTPALAQGQPLSLLGRDLSPAALRGSGSWILVPGLGSRLVTLETPSAACGCRGNLARPGRGARLRLRPGGEGGARVSERHLSPAARAGGGVALATQ